MARLRDSCRTLRERALIEVLRSTGARVGEIVEITVDQINWETGDILILGEKVTGIGPYIWIRMLYTITKILELQDRR